MPLPGKAPCLVGGRGEAEPSSLITECLGRMVAWSTLASEVASTEFPEFELLACFQVFKLTEPLPSPSTAPVYLERLAQTFKVPLGSGIEHLVDQFLEHQKIALGLKVAGEPAATSWQRAVQKTQQDSRNRANFHCGELGPLLCRFVVSPGSTAGIEQNFSVFKRVLGEHTCASELGEERRLVLHVASCTMPNADATLLARARLIWAKSFGAPRANTTGTLRGLMKAKPSNESTCTSWLRKRRDRVHKSMTTPTVDQAVQDAGKVAWTAKHEAELNFQKGVRLEHHCAAVQQGVANKESLGPDATEQMDAYQRSLLKREHNLTRKAALTNKKQTTPVMPKLQGLSVFADAEATQSLSPNHQSGCLLCKGFSLNSYRIGLLPLCSWS